MTEQTRQQKSWYDRRYKLFLIIPVLITILCAIYIGYFYLQHNDIILKDVSLSGGTTITIQGEINADSLEQQLEQEYSDINFRKLTDLNSGKLIATIIESSASPENLKSSIEQILGYPLTDENSSTEFSGPTLGQSFYKELIKIVFLAFILMALVIFLIFGESIRTKLVSAVLSLSAIRLTFPAKFSLLILIIIIGIIALAYAFMKTKSKKQLIYPSIVLLIFIISIIYPAYYLIFIIAIILFATYFLQSLPSIAVIFAAFADIVMALAVIDFFGIKISAAGLAAFLMLIGYSVDTDILLTTRALRKREGALNERIYGAFKTGIFMTLTGLIAVLPAFFIVTGLPDSFRQIFLILAIGLGADIINTWLTNAGIIKWYCEKKNIK